MKTNTSFTNKIYIWEILSKVLSLRTKFPDLKALPSDKKSEANIKPQNHMILKLKITN